MRQKSRFVASIGGLIGEVTRQEKWRIGLDHQTIAGDVGNACTKCRSATFIADPPGDTDMQIKLTACLEQRRVSGKTVQNRGGQVRSVFFDDGQEIAFGVALVQKGRAPALRGERKLLGESLALDRAR